MALVGYKVLQTREKLDLSVSLSVHPLLSGPHTPLASCPTMLAGSLTPPAGPQALSAGLQTPLNSQTDGWMVGPLVSPSYQGYRSDAANLGWFDLCSLYASMPRGMPIML